MVWKEKYPHEIVKKNCEMAKYYLKSEQSIHIMHQRELLIEAQSNCQTQNGHVRRKYYKRITIFNTCICHYPRLREYTSIYRQSEADYIGSKAMSLT